MPEIRTRKPLALGHSLTGCLGRKVVGLKVGLLVPLLEGSALRSTNRVTAGPEIHPIDRRQ